MRSRLHLLTLAIVALDHLTKWAVLARLDLDGPAVEIVPGYLRLSHVQNTGVAFGMLNRYDAAWKPYALALLALGAAIFILVYAARIPHERRLLRTALAVTLGGIVGNLIDRVARGFVVDFIEFHVHESFYWPNFNVADSAITIGIGLLLLDSFRPAGRKAPDEASPAEQEP